MAREWKVAAVPTYTGIENWDYAGERDDEQLQCLACGAPILGIERRICRLWPEHLGSVGRKFEPRGNHFAKLNFGFSNVR
jgi:hypothetical protein